jgi:hypothetical protein
LRLEIVPGVCLVGRANGAILAADPDLAEALPVRDARFEVHGGVARLVPDPPVVLRARPDHVALGVQVGRNQATMRGGRHGRVAFELDVAPWRCYHLAVRIAGERFAGGPRVRVVGDGHELAWASVPPPRADSFETRDVVFNSLAHRHVTIAFGASRASRGTLRWRDWRIEEAGPVNVVRRPGMAFRFEGLAEGRDFEPVVDPRLGASPARGRFDAWHDPPEIRVHRPDGTRLRGSWQHAAVLLGGQVACCLSDTAVLARERVEIALVRRLFGARRLFLMHDEIRALGWDEACAATGRSAARILADHVRALRGAAGGESLCVWNDMFDPHQNAVPDYYLVNGDLRGSWEGLDSSMVVVNWNHEHAEASLRFFAARGHRQVWAGYYDGAPGDIGGQRRVLDRVPGVVGIMYTTWRGRYDDLEAFAKAAR